MKLFVCLAVLVAACAAQEARLLVAKEVVNTRAVVGRDLTIRYSLYNTGDAEATDITLSDTSFEEENSGFQLVSGLTSVNFASLTPQANVSHHVVVQAEYSGYYNLSAATVTYKASPDAQSTVSAISSEPKQIPIAPNDDFARAFDTHLFEWVVVLAAAVGLVYFPFSMFQASVAAYKKQE
ncbi:uncharacterized protein MONBRDRAFT_35798 [Monosiga brevicollis MX1]|uniref:Translocon-associated protein subunit beta n=1 Tax=Monosiga brevicollis TaxID=81824 RepID=A9URW9_MONBE|nr:uncharacterized protein MONBRDRAFT_35798 [Monosiga brevicollis MX1]EDQ91678.1 predicted protein [Monosiga brevicollis MX1]|eukprot:XP_001742964.1 hypothetical protein [Monosiga brevicollis MX1]